MAGKKNIHFKNGPQDQQATAGKHLKVKLVKSNAIGAEKENAPAGEQESCPQAHVPKRNISEKSRYISWKKREKPQVIKISFYKHFSEMNALERISLLARLPVFAPKPVCEFMINGSPMIGRFEKTEKSLVYLRVFFSRKPVQFPIGQIQSVKVIKY